MALARSFLLLIFLSSPALAVELKVGASLIQFDYQEKLSSGKSHEVGWFPSLDVGARWQPDFLGKDFLSLAWSSTYNIETTYYGTNLTTLQSITERDTHTFHHLEGVYEHEASPLGIFYVGFSYDRWDRFLAYGTGYREIYQWWTLPIGVRFPVMFGRGSWMVLDLAARPMISGTMRAIFSETISNGDDTDFTLGNEWGLRIRLPYELYGDRWRFEISPWFETYRFGESGWKYNNTPGIQQGIREPASETVKSGLSLSWKVLF